VQSIALSILKNTVFYRRCHFDGRYGKHQDQHAGSQEGAGMTPNYSILTPKELLTVAYGLWAQVEELRREVERLRSVKAAMEANIGEKW